MNVRTSLVALLLLASVVVVAPSAAASHPCMTSLDCAASKVLMKPSCVLEQKGPSLGFLFHPFCRNPL